MSWSRLAVDLLSLTKPRLSSLVLGTAAGGMWLAPGRLAVWEVVGTLLAIAGTVGAANTLNCYLERDLDRLMSRTRNRPLPAGRVQPKVALGFVVLLAVVSLPALVWGANFLTGLLGLVALLMYVLVYTPLKRRTPGAMLVGAVPGALPPLMGWTSVTGALELPGLALFAILFCWQLPHFLAIALFRKDEYAAAGMKSVPLVRGEDAARVHILAYLLLLAPVTLTPYGLGVAGPAYLLVAVLLGGLFFGLGAWGYLRRLGEAWARQLFYASLVHLTGLFVVLMLDGRSR